MPRTEVFDREQAITNGMNLFWKKGFNGTSMQEIVDATGLGRSSLYNSFGSKMEFFKLTLDHYQEMNAREYRKLLSKEKNPVEKIRTIFEQNIDHASSDTERKGCFMVNTTTELANCNQDLHAWLTKKQEAITLIFEEIIAEGQRNNIINKMDSPKNYSLYLYSSLKGIRVSAITITDKKVLASILEKTLEILK